MFTFNVWRVVVVGGGKVVVRHVIACRVVERCIVVERRRTVVSVQLVAKDRDKIYSTDVTLLATGKMPPPSRCHIMTKSDLTKEILKLHVG